MQMRRDVINKRMCPKLRHIYYAVVASGACERSTLSHTTCWGSTPDPLEHDSHAAVRVCFANIAQNSRSSVCDQWAWAAAQQASMWIRLSTYIACGDLNSPS